ncbi:hypothetical protein CC78DRAFT_540572 [Lojkania enalia]|uniref:Uncharacterized protein n=1 Tax=Lojkania enalia TaxID=147567 RepID=A0A9P4N3P6_9PLEO|nr:hypothetical protein CC78DRAFT_540572 [Didymosphaeria enalia]
MADAAGSGFQGQWGRGFTHKGQIQDFYREVEPSKAGMLEGGRVEPAASGPIQPQELIHMPITNMQSMLSRAPANHSLQEPLPARKASPIQLTYTNNWNAAYEYNRTVTVAPFLDHKSDETILQVLQDREFWVGSLVAAIINLENVRDRVGSYERKFFLQKLDMKAIESVARTIFAALIDQVVQGYRGFRQSRLYSATPNEEFKDDQCGDCLTRISNVINVLRMDKKVCKGVINDSTRILDLVFAPLKVAKTKLDNERNNDQKRQVTEKRRHEEQMSPALKERNDKALEEDRETVGVSLLLSRSPSAAIPETKSEARSSVPSILNLTAQSRDTSSQGLPPQDFEKHHFDLSGQRVGGEINFRPRELSLGYGSTNPHSYINCGYHTRDTNFSYPATSLNTTAAGLLLTSSGKRLQDPPSVPAPRSSVIQKRMKVQQSGSANLSNLMPPKFSIGLSGIRPQAGETTIPSSRQLVSSNFARAFAGNINSENGPPSPKERFEDTEDRFHVLYEKEGEKAQNKAVEGRGRCGSKKKETRGVPEQGDH